MKKREEETPSKNGRFGHCPKCPKSQHPVRLYGTGVCSYHLTHDLDLSKASTVQEIRAEQAKEEALRQYWRDQAARMPRYCENKCGTHLPTAGSSLWVIKASIAHIVEKRHFLSVIVHPDNCFFPCKNCHTNYDDRGHSFQSTMPVWPLIVERFARFMEYIKKEERQYLHPQLWEMLDKAHPL